MQETTVNNIISPSQEYEALLINEARMKKKLSSKSSWEDMCRLPISFLLNIQSRLKQEVDIPQIQNCVTRYSSPY